MFARFRPAARSLRSVRAYSSTPVVRAQVPKAAPSSSSSSSRWNSGGAQLLLVATGAAALATAISTVDCIRSHHVAPSPPKEEKEEEEAEEEKEEEVEEVSISAAADAALTKLQETAAAVDDEVSALVAAAEAALARTSGGAVTEAEAALPDPAEAANQGAFNEETGEINWDCPCLGGMAHGPCGEEFKAAFSCFVYSEEEPKGIDCVEKFKGMQDCFRAHPDVYAEEIDDDEEAQAEAAQANEAQKE